MTIINCENGTVQVSPLFVKYSNVFQSLLSDIPDDNSESLPLNSFSKEDVLLLNKLVCKLDTIYIEEPKLEKEKYYGHYKKSTEWSKLKLDYEISPDAIFYGIHIYNPNTSESLYPFESRQKILDYIETNLDNFIINVCKHDGYIPYVKLIREEIIDNLEVSQIIDMFKLVNFLDMPAIENILVFMMGVILRYESYEKSIYVFEVFKNIRLKLNHITDFNLRKSNLRNNPWYNFDSILKILNKTHLNIINYTASFVLIHNESLAKLQKDFDNNNVFNTMEYWDITDLTNLSLSFTYLEGIYDTIESYKKRILLSNKYCLLWNTSNVTHMNSLFEGTDLNAELPWHTSNVIDMNRMFCNCRKFDRELNWDTSNVQDMMEMFMGCTSFNQTLKFKTHNLTLMSGIFKGCTSFNQSLNWDITNVTSLQCAFQGCWSFNQPLEWNTINVIDLRSTFKYCSKFNQPLKWNTKNVLFMDDTFLDCESFNQPLKWNTENAVSMKCTFLGASAFNQQLKWNTKNVKTMSRMFYFATNFDKKLYWNTKNVCNFNKMFVNTQVTSVNQLDISSVTKKKNLKCF